MANIWGNNANSDRLYFGGSKITADGDACDPRAVIHVIRLAVFCGCGFQSVCPCLAGASPLPLDMEYLLTVSSTSQLLLQRLPSYWGFSALGRGALANSKFPISRRIPQREIVATPRTLQLVIWDPVGSECFSWQLWDFIFNFTGGIYRETTSLIQDGSSPSLSRDQEIYLLFVVEYNLCQAVPAL